MACNSPLTGVRHSSGRVSIKANGAGLVPGSLRIACGQCMACRLEHSRQWAVRCMHEASLHEKNCFVTLTYSDRYLPAGNSLDLSDWQNFAKYARKKMGSFRFYHVGEYGDMHGRAHLHALLFGIDFGEDRFEIEESKQGFPQWESKTLDQLWGKGRSTIGECTFESAAYCARYVVQKIAGAHAKYVYKYLGQKAPYSTMSRKPGLGAGWIEKYRKDVYRDDIVIVNGKKTRPPSFYDKVLEESELEELKIRRQEKAERHAEDNTSERLRVKERVLNKKYEDLIHR